MSPEEREMLKRSLELSQENNKILRAMQRHMFIGRILRIIYWVIIIGAGVGVYYYIEPYLDGAVNAYGSVKGDLQSFGDLFR